MNRLNTGLSVALALCAVLALGSAVTAGTTGKVMGVVMDEKGDPLPGASVVLEGTQRGSTTDADGSYVIVSVDPDVYKAMASMVGYHSSTQEQVIVRADFTTTLNFRLREQALELEEMVVVAERPPVEPDKTESRYVVSSEEIRRTPILRNVEQFVELEAGIAVDGSQFIRGSPPDETSFVVDGIRMQQSDKRIYVGYDSGNNLDWNAPGTAWWKGVNTDAVQEISVITGGMNAEYGNAMTGVIQLITRDGEAGYHGEVEYRLTPAGKKHWGANVYDAPEHRGNAKWDDPEWVSEVDPETGRLVHQRLNYTDWRSHYYDGFLSGPLLGQSSFFVSARHVDEATRVPGRANRTPTNIRTTAKLTMAPGANVKFRLGWIYDYSEYWRGGRSPNWAGVSNVTRSTGRHLFIPEGSPGGKVPSPENMLYATWTHTVSPKTFYEIKVSHYVSREDSSETTGKTTSDQRTDKSGHFYLGRESMWNYTIAEQKRTTLKADLSSQFRKGHFIKTGVEFVKYSNWFTWEVMFPDGQKAIEIVGKGSVPGEPQTPSELGFYVQDKMEFEGLIVNAGIRYDMFYGIDAPFYGGFRSFMYDSLSRWQHVPHYRLKPWTNWSPRLGISHPITDRSAMHFSYGHFAQTPGFRRMFQEMWITAGKVGVPGVPFSEYVQPKWPTGTTALWPSFELPQKKINTEVGVDWNFVSDYVFTLATFYNSGINQSSGQWQNIRNPFTSGRLYVSGTGATWWEDTRGFELSLRKSFSHYFAFRAAFNLEWTGEYYGGKGTSSIGVGVAMDSTFIMNSPVMVEWEEGDGFQRPVPMSEARRREALGGAMSAQDVSNNNLAIVFYSADIETKTFDDRPNLTDEARAAAKGLYYLEDWLGGNRDDITAGKRSQGSLQMFFSTPADLGAGPRIGGSTLLGNLRANLIYRIYTGSKFKYPTLDGKSTYSRGPLHTNVDLSVQKRLNLGKVNADLFVEVLNLFNQKDAGASGVNYMYYGLQIPPPDDASYQEFGDVSDRSRYLGSPRESHVGIRLSF